MRISNQPLFIDQDKKALILEEAFRPLDNSIVWQLNSIFWKYYDVWVKTYGEKYQEALPKGISQSHAEDFIAKSSSSFFENLKHIQILGQLPDEILVLEQGPGTGEYAKGFLDNMEKWSSAKYPFYKRIFYLLSDESQQMLKEAEKNLRKHSLRISTILQDDLYHISSKFRKKILFARHGNLWDQLPCRIFRKTTEGINEVYVRAILNTGEISKHEAKLLQTFKKNLNDKNLENIILEHPQLWKTFVKALRLQINTSPVSKLVIESIPHFRILNELIDSAKINTEIVFSPAILDNLTQLAHLVDWERGGYIEIVDIVAANGKELSKQREPRKFDGTIALAVNAPQVIACARQNAKHVHIKKLSRLNKCLTVINNDLESQLRKREFIYMSEIAAPKKQNVESLISTAKKYSQLGIDAIAFSDQAHGWDSFQSIQELLDTSTFSLAEAYNPVPVFVTRRKSWKEIHDLILRLKEQRVKQLFVVTGDASQNRSDESGIMSYEALPLLSKHFFTGTVTKAKIEEIPWLIQKVQLGARFFIVQSTYDHKELIAWIDEIKKLKLHMTNYFIMSMIPIVTQKTIAAIQDFPDVPIGEDILKRFANMNDKETRVKGMKLANSLGQFYLKQGIFSGLYIFAKSPAVVQEIKESLQNS